MSPRPTHPRLHLGPDAPTSSAASQPASRLGAAAHADARSGSYRSLQPNGPTRPKGRTRHKEVIMSLTQAEPIDDIFDVAQPAITTGPLRKRPRRSTRHLAHQHLRIAALEREDAEAVV